jgi:hypothetical protein
MTLSAACNSVVTKWHGGAAQCLNSAHRRERRQAARAAEAATGLKRICGPSGYTPLKQLSL